MEELKLTSTACDIIASLRINLPKDFSAPYIEDANISLTLAPLQVGNAVPPPMAKAIGLEMKKCVEEKSKIAN